MAFTIEDAFESGRLIRPDSHKPNLVQLVQALASLCGVKDLESTPGARGLADLIGGHDHLIFILMDGLGMNTIRRLPADSFVASNLKLQLQATCPSTTACALTTVATAQYPNRHGITGWFTYLPRYDLTMTTLPFKERFSERPLIEREIFPRDVVAAAPICPRMTHHPLTITPANIAETTYNVFCRAGTRGVGYNSIGGAVGRIIEEVRAARAPSYTHLYLPEIDTICHKLGVEHPDVVPQVMNIDRELSRLADAIGGRARIVVSADHGLIDVPRDRQTLLFEGDPLLQMLLAPSSGDARMPIFHVHSEARDRFVDRFLGRFGDRMYLLSADECERLELFGPGAISERVRGRFGDFVAFPYEAATLAFHPPGKPVGELFLAVHGGLSPQEMWVPLSIA